MLCKNWLQYSENSAVVTNDRTSFVYNVITHIGVTVKHAFAVSIYFHVQSCLAPEMCLTGLLNHT